MRTLISLLFLLSLTACDNNTWQPFEHTDWNPEVIAQDPGLQRYTDEKTKLMGYKTMDGEIVIPAKFKIAQDFNKHGIAMVLKKPSKGDKKPHDNWYAINRDGETLVKSYFFDNGADYFVSGLSRYVDEGKVGFINHQGEIVIKATHDWARPFSFNAPVSLVCDGCKSVSIPGTEYSETKGGKWGAMDKSGKIVIPLDYDGFSFKSYQFTKGDKCFTPLWDAKDAYKIEEKECGE